MKIIKVLEKTELVIDDLEVNLGKEKRNGLHYALNIMVIIIH